MCNEIIIETRLDFEEAIAILKDIFGEDYFESDWDKIQSDITWWDIGSFNEIVINGLNDGCLCNISNEDKLKLFDFIYKISGIA
jgi:hypothetical protein